MKRILALLLVPFLLAAQPPLTPEQKAIKRLEQAQNAARTASGDTLTQGTADGLYQPLNSNLTSLASGLTAAGLALVDDAANSNQRTTLGLAIGSNVQAFDSDLSTWAGLTPSAFFQTLVDDADAAAARVTLGAVIGTNVQAFDTDLTTWAGLTPSAFVQTILDDADGAAVRSTIGALASASYTAADVLSKLVTVDGASSGLDADLLDGSSSAAFALVGHDHAATYQPLATSLTRLVANCTIENDATPIPDSCVGDGTDAGGGGVDTANSPNANEFARFTDADTIEGRTAAEAKADLDLEIGTDLAPSNLDYLVGTASANLSAEIAVGTSPGGELGGTWAAPTLDDTVTVDGWTMGASVATTPSANDSDTSLATTAFVQGEIDDVDNLSDNCAVENDATPVPDSCVGDGSDANTLGSDGDKGDVVVGGTGTTLTLDSGVVTAAAKTVLDDASVGAMLATLLGAPLASPTFTGTVTTPGTLAIGAGSASASSWPKVTAGTVLTTAEDGAIEEDADNFYLTTDAGNRGIVPTQHYLRAASDQTLTSAGTAQNIFDSPANGRFTLETGTYTFELQLIVTGMSATSGNAAILFACGGSCADWNWQVCGLDNTTPATISGDLCVYLQTNTTAASAVTAAAGTALRISARGSVEVTAGTFTPQLTLVTAAAAIVESGSYFTITRIGATATTSVGQTD